MVRVWGFPGWVVTTMVDCRRSSGRLADQRWRRKRRQIGDDEGAGQLGKYLSVGLRRRVPEPKGGSGGGGARLGSSICAVGKKQSVGHLRRGEEKEEEERNEGE